MAYPPSLVFGIVSMIGTLYLLKELVFTDKKEMRDVHLYFLCLYLTFFVENEVGLVLITGHDNLNSFFFFVLLVELFFLGFSLLLVVLSILFYIKEHRSLALPTASVLCIGAILSVPVVLTVTEIIPFTVFGIAPTILLPIVHGTYIALEKISPMQEIS
ncbi:MAG: hypothetical protein HGA67_00060 [Candidatus Yonathbacteria bacterium]|nr:hypothetical protein [Candidatus Yonathbacteria bacterium]